MTWVAVTSSVATFSAMAASVKDWTASSTALGTWGNAPTAHDTTWPTSTVPVVPPAWTMGSPVEESDGGTDFVITLSDQFPWYLTEDRPIVLRDTYTDI